jgi:hypothetical protein
MACPDHEWRLLLALARYGGLRTPSEPLALEWTDVNWERQRFRVIAPKTEHQDGGERWVPLFPELKPFLEDAWDRAKPGQTYVITRWRDTEKNLRTGLNRILRRAGVKPWPRLYQNLRASRETELAESFPIHVVAEWLGNSPKTALAHYTQVTEEHYQRAAKSGAVEVQKPVQQGAAPSRALSQDSSQVLMACDVLREGADQSDLRQDKWMTPTGSEPHSANTYEKSELGNPTATGAAKSGAVSGSVVPSDPDLARLIGAWPTLPSHIKAALLALAGMAAGHEQPVSKR